MTAFGPRDLDALQELATIGCGQAITALGKLTGRRIEMDVPEAWVGAEAGAIAAFLGGLGQDLVVVGVRLEGALTGDLLLALPERDAEGLAALLGFPPSFDFAPRRTPRRYAQDERPQEVPSGSQSGDVQWGGMAESALMESGNIVGSAFVSAVGTLVHEKLLLSVPTFARGSGKACVERLVAHEGSIAFATRFTLAAEAGRTALEGLILVMPEPDRIARLLSHLDLR
jgi:chemotaxis protein CheC